MAFETASISTPEYGQQIQGRKGANFYCINSNKGTARKLDRF